MADTPSDPKDPRSVRNEYARDWLANSSGDGSDEAEMAYWEEEARNDAELEKRPPRPNPVPIWHRALLDKEAAAAYLSVSPRWIETYVLSRVGTIKHSRLTLIPRAELDRFAVEEIHEREERHDR
jgi:hypothetical protein